MKITQLATLLNQVLPEGLGTEAVGEEDLTNLVDIGRAIADLSSADFENFMKKLPDRIGKTVFVDRPYSGRAPSVMMDGWQYGSILQKIRTELPEAEDNPTWALQDGQDYKLTEFHAPVVSAKYFNQKDTSQIKMSFARKQVESAFTSAQGVNALFSLIQDWIQKRKTIDRDNLTMRTINTFIGAIMSEVGATPRKINLLTEFNTETDASLTVANCLYDLDFLKYAAYRIAVTSDRMENMSKLFNIGGTSKFTPKSMQHIVMLSDFAKRADIYLQSDTFHNEFTKLPAAERVSFWQGSGTGYTFDDISSINVKIKDPKNPSGDQKTVSQKGILACIWDRDALGICNVRDYVTSFYVPSAEFENMWYKTDHMFFNDYDENGVVFYVAEE